MNKTIFTAVFFFISPFVLGKDLGPNENWFRCSADEDCIEIKYSCTGAVVHKKFVKEANQYHQDLNSRINCVQINPTEDQKKTPYKVFCKANKCGSQGVYPKKPGFS